MGAFKEEKIEYLEVKSQVVCHLCQALEKYIGQKQRYNFLNLLLPKDVFHWTRNFHISLDVEDNLIHYHRFISKLATCMWKPTPLWSEDVSMIYNLHKTEAFVRLQITTKWKETCTYLFLKHWRISTSSWGRGWRREVAPWGPLRHWRLMLGYHVGMRMIATSYSRARYGV